MTIQQKQCLLCYLGYYHGEIDGSFGPASKAATEDFQRDFGLEVDGSFGPATKEKILEIVGSGVTEKTDNGEWWNGIQYFKREEYRCKCGGKYCDGYPVEPKRKLVETEDAIRAYFGKRANNSSGIRCVQHNANVGGVVNSRHLLGKAVDFRIEGVSAAEVVAYAKTMQNVRYTYAIDGSYVHVDVE